MKTVKIFIVAVLLINVASPAWAFGTKADRQNTQTADKVPAEIQDIGITEHLGEKIDLNLEFTNEEGQTVPLQTYFDGERPVLFSLVYYNCPSLCNLHLNGVTDTLKEMKWSVGNEFDFVVLTIDPNEKHDLAAKKKQSYIESYERESAQKGWHFLTGSEENIKKLSEQLGFKYKWDEKGKQWAHQAAAYVLSPDGMISRYLYGIQFAPKTMRLSLVEASNNKVGNIVDRIVLFCLHYDPALGTYSFYAFNLVRLLAASCLIVLMVVLIRFWKKQRRVARA